jgi:hypothetical protein
MCDAPTEDKCYDTKDRFYEELDRVFNQFPSYSIKTYFDDFSAKVEKNRYFQTDNWERAFTRN